MNWNGTRQFSHFRFEVFGLAANGHHPDDVWWRAEDRRYANYDPWAEFEQPSGSHLVIRLTPYVVERATPKGVFLKHYGFVRGNATKQWAVPTQELALRDLIARKRVQVSFCQHRLDRAIEHMEASEQALARIQKEASK